MGTFRLTVEVTDRRHLPAILREAADQIEATSSDRRVSGRIDGSGGLIGVFVLVDDDPRWQATMRRQFDEAVTPAPPANDDVVDPDLQVGPAGGWKPCSSDPRSS
jgi:hypothetical protein